MWWRILYWVRENLSAILGTLAFHMVLVIVFLMVKISSTKSVIDSLVVVEFIEEEEESMEDALKTIEVSSVEAEEIINRLISESRRNIPVNLANEMNEEVSTEEYVKQVVEDLEANRNREWLEAQERYKELMEMESGADMIMDADQQSSTNEQEIYKGPTTIYYSIENRYHIHLPLPVYKCEGAGDVKVMIVVDQKGRVVQANVQELGSTLNEVCFTEAAGKAALESRFNADFNAPLRQKGTITYHFIAQ